MVVLVALVVLVVVAVVVLVVAAAVVVIATKDCSYDKIVGNVQEVRARDGKIISIVTEGDTEIAELSERAAAEDMSLSVKPVLCITDKRNPSCDMAFLVMWQSALTGYYCLFNDFDDVPVRCWNEERTVAGSPDTGVAEAPLNVSEPSRAPCSAGRARP